MISQAHLLTAELKINGWLTEALWAKASPGQAVIFVHGLTWYQIMDVPIFPFRKPPDTAYAWGDFISLLLQSTRTSTSDFIFYKYDACNQVVANASLLTGFIQGLWQNPSNLVNPSLNETDHRPESFRYRRLILVAHSLGAVIARKALYEGYRAGVSWASNTELVLFAPAHNGTSILSLVEDIIKSARVIRLYCEVLSNADATSSVVCQFRRNVEELIGRGNAPTLTAKKVIIAERDKIIADVSFDSDSAPETIPGATHRTVCKPRHDQFLEPFTHLVSVL